MFFPQIPSAILNLAEPEPRGETPLAPKKISSHPLNISLCSLTRDSSVIYPRELQHSGPQSAFCFSGHSAPSIIFPGRADSEQQFKASSRLAPASAVALGNRPLSPPPPLQHGGWGELISSTPLSTKVREASGLPELCSGHDPYPLANTQILFNLRGHTHAHIHLYIHKCTLWDWRCLDFLPSTSAACFVIVIPTVIIF